MKIRKTLLWLILAGVLALGLLPGVSTTARAITAYGIGIDCDTAKGSVTAEASSMTTEYFNYPNIAVEDDTVTLTVTPVDGNALSELTVKRVKDIDKVSDIVTAIDDKVFTGNFGSSEATIQAVNGSLVLRVGTTDRDTLSGNTDLIPGEMMEYVTHNDNGKYYYHFNVFSGGFNKITVTDSDGYDSDFTCQSKIDLTEGAAITPTKVEDEANKYAFTMPKGDVVVKAVFDEPTVPHTHGTISFKKWTDALAAEQNGADATAANSLPSVPGSYYLDNDVTLSETWEAPQNGSNGVTSLCLNGHTIKLAEDSNDYNVMYVSRGRTLNIYDEDGKQGKITGGRQFGIYNGYGTINLYDGTISDNAESGICNYGGTLEMYGGTITRNNNREHGGGVYNTGTFHMHGGVITGNNVQLNNGYGRGGGVFVQSGTTFTVDGSAQIYGNTAGTGDEAVENNVCVDYYHKENSDPRIGIIEVTGPLNDDAKISVCMVRRKISTDYKVLEIGYVPGVFTSSTGDVKAKDYIGKFSSDSSEYSVLAAGDELKLAEKARVYNVTTKVKDDVGGTVTADPDKVEEAGEGTHETVTVSATPIDGYEMKGEYISAISIPRPKTVGDLFNVLGNKSYIASDETVIWVNHDENRLQCNKDGVVFDYAPADTQLTKTDEGGYACTGSASNPQSWIFTINDEGKVNINWSNVDFGDSTGTLAETVNLTYVTTEEKTVKYQFTMPDADVVVKAEFYEIHQHHVGESDIIFDTRWTKTDSLPGSAGDYYLTEDITLTESWNVPAGTINLCLNGHTIKAAEGASISVITVPANATLNVYDYSGATGETIDHAATPGSITGGKGTTYRTGDHDAKRGGGVLVQGTFNMYGGTITGNILDCATGSNGGGVVVDANGQFELRGGAITGNTVNASNMEGQRGVGHGSAVMVSGGGTFNMKGGEISGNTGVYGEVSLLGNAKANITGGTITRNNENQAVHTNADSGKFELTVGGDATINGNSGIAFSIDDRNKEGAFTLTGSSEISPTISGTVQLATPTSMITLNGYKGGQITVDKGEPGVFTSGGSFNEEANPDAAAQAVFASGNPDYLVGATENGQARLYQPPVDYMAWDDASRQLVLKTGDEACTTYKVVTANTTTLENGKWYVVNDNVTNRNRINVTGTANLILMDGKTLNAGKGIHVNGSNQLNIYGQTNGNGALSITGVDDYNAALGGNNGESNGSVTIHGGTITANARDGAAGIGSGRGEVTSGPVTIYGGNVTANGGYREYAGAGIGGGDEGNCGPVTIYGGNVTANGGGGYFAGAGIGGGAYGIGGTVKIYGGNVTANGGGGDTAGAGIGGGCGGPIHGDGNGGTVEIYGGIVRASGRFEKNGQNLSTGIGRGRNAVNDGILKVAATHVIYGNDSAITDENKTSSQVMVQGEGVDTQLDIARKPFMLVVPGQVPVPYQELSWNGSAVVATDKYCEDYTVVTADTTSFENGKWYVVKNIVTNDNNRITVTGTANLILVNNAQLNAKKGITTIGATLNVYGQKPAENAQPGELNGITTEAGNAGIGGVNGEDGGTLNVHGGKVMGWGGTDAAGIGGGNGGAGGTINVYGGTVRNLISDTGSKAAGIGGGANGDGGTVTVYGGTVIAHRDTEGAAIGGGVGSSDDGKLYVATTHAVYSDESNIDLEHTDNVAYKQQGKGVNTELDITRQQNMTIVEGLVTYPIWVGGTQVTSANATNITGEETVTASYDADNHTLTLNGATISGGSYKNAAIYAEGMNLTIDVKGDSTVTGPANSTSYGIYLHPGSLTITGVGTLTAAGGTGSDSTGIRTHKYNPSDTCNVTIAADTSLTAIGNGTSYSDGVNAEGVVTVNGTLTAISGTCSNSRGINVNAMSGNYTVIINENGKLTASGNKAIVGTVKNAVAGTSWTNVEGTEGAALIEVSADEGQTLSQDNKKVQFPKSKATVTTAPVAAALIYNGEAQALVTAGEATGGEMRYAYVTDADAEPDESAYSADIPTAIETGIYYVWYKAVGDGPHIDSEPGYVTVEIVSTDASGSATAQTLPYTAQPQPLVKGGEVVGGYLEYVLGGDDVTAPAEGWSTEVPTGTDPGTYYVWYKVVPDKNHNPYGPKCVVVTIEPPVVKPTEEPTPDVPEEVKPEPEQVSDYTLFATMKTSGKKALKLSWTKVPEAEGYDVFFGLCGQGDAPLYKSVSGQSLTVKKLKQKTAYKARVYAWKTVNGAKTYIGTSSPIVHTITGGSNKKYTNAKKISVKKKKLSVATGKTVAIKTSLKKVKSGKKLLNHTSKVRYFSNNHNIASVSANGKVTGVSAGTCMVYAIAENGLRVGVQITVK